MSDHHDDDLAAALREYDGDATALEADLDALLDRADDDDLPAALHATDVDRLVLLDLLTDIRPKIDQAVRAVRFGLADQGLAWSLDGIVERIDRVTR